MSVDGEPREPSGSALGRLLAKCTTKVSSTVPKGVGERRSGWMDLKDPACPDDVVNELRANSTHRPSVPLKSRVEQRSKTVYVLGERLERNKSVPRTKDGRCVKALKINRLCSKSRRRVQPVEAYNHYKEYAEDDEREYARGGEEEERGEEVMPSKSMLAWEARGFVSWG